MIAQILATLGAMVLFVCIAVVVGLLALSVVLRKMWDVD